MKIYNTISQIQANMVKLNHNLQREKEIIMRSTGTRREKRILKISYYTNLINKVFEDLGYERAS